MTRINSEGIPQEHLRFALKNSRIIADARRIDACLMCRRPRVNVAGICEYCYSQLDGEELVMVTRIMSGVDA